MELFILMVIPNLAIWFVFILAITLLFPKGGK